VREVKTRMEKLIEIKIPQELYNEIYHIHNNPEQFCIEAIERLIDLID